jgi:hypothetical protein
MRRRDLVLGIAPALVASSSSRADSWTWTIDFEPERWDLSERAITVCRQVATTYLGSTSTSLQLDGPRFNVGRRRVELSGRAEPSEPDGQALSLRRARAVISELLRQGVMATDIGVTALGATQPQPAGANNRSVELRLL